MYHLEPTKPIKINDCKNLEVALVVARVFSSAHRCSVTISNPECVPEFVATFLDGKIINSCLYQ